jgi:SWIM zinc finger
MSESTVEAPPRWSADQVLSLAPDATAQRAARTLAGDQGWCEAGLSVEDGVPPTVWGLCQGSGQMPYQTCVDLTEPAYRCTCPSRKFPCKHTLAILLRWASGAVPPAPAPAWVRAWQASRSERSARATARTEIARTGGDGTGRAASERATTRRAGRVAAGLRDLDRWLEDQVRGGLAGASRLGYAHWDSMAARLIDAQAPGAARLVRNLAGYAGDPERLLAEIGLLRLLTAGFARVDHLPPALAAIVRLRVGMPVSAEEVLATAAVRDHWQVLGARDELEENLMVRRVWLRGAATGRAALVLSFAGPGQVFVTDLVPGTEFDADLCFYPERLRVLIARRHAPPRPITALAGSGPAAAMHEQARALAADPWLERWPMVLSGVVPARRPGPGAAPAGWCLTGDGVRGVPVDPAAGAPWRLVALAGGRPLTVAGEWSVTGLRPLGAWTGDRLVWL